MQPSQLTVFFLMCKSDPTSALFKYFLYNPLPLENGSNSIAFKILQKFALKTFYRIFRNNLLPHSYSHYRAHRLFHHSSPCRCFPSMFAYLLGEFLPFKIKFWCLFCALLILKIYVHILALCFEILLLFFTSLEYMLLILMRFFFKCYLFVFYLSWNSEPSPGSGKQQLMRFICFGCTSLLGKCFHLGKPAFPLNQCCIKMEFLLYITSHSVGD